MMSPQLETQKKVLSLRVQLREFSTFFIVRALTSFCGTSDYFEYVRWRLPFMQKYLM